MDEKKENKMGTMPVGKLLVSMSLPAMFSMMVQALYNIVDSIFVSRFSEMALTAVSLAFPIQTLMISFAVGTSIGITSVVSRRLGEKREEDAFTAAQTGYTILLIWSAVFSVLGLTAVKLFFRLYTDDPVLLKMGTDYLSICTVFGVGCFILTYTEKVLQGTGDTIHPMIIQISGAVFNIIFDPIFIFGYFGLPAMGAKGAAIATVLGQLLSMMLGIHFVHKSPYVSIHFSKIKYDRQSAKNILQVGIPSVIMQGIGTIMTSLINAILITFDILATTVFGVYFKLQSFVFMPVFGMNQGLMPILGYNYGAKNRKRMMKALKLGLVTAFVIMSLGTVLFCAIPDKLLGLFNASDAMLSIGKTALRRISMSFPIAAYCIIIGSLFQAIGDGYKSMIISIVRQIIFLIPSAYIFGKIAGLDAVWFSFICAEIISASLTTYYLLKTRKKLNF